MSLLTLPMPTTLTRTHGEPRTSEYSERILFLSGRWSSSIQSEFVLRATIRVLRDGGAEGAIYWRSLKIAAHPQVIFGTELVHGCVQSTSVELRGHRTDPGLAVDVYDLVLTGTDEAGTFGGRSRAYGDWSGRLSGTYVYRNRA